MATAVAEKVREQPLAAVCLEESYQYIETTLVGKTALVTGASRGIGRAIALALARAGANVAVTCITSGTLAEQVRDEIRKLGRQAEAYAHNVADPGEVEKLHTEVVRDFGQVDIVVN